MADAMEAGGREPTILNAANALEAQRKTAPSLEVPVLPTKQLTEAEGIQAAVDRTQQIGQNLGSSEQSVTKVAFQQSVDQGKGLPTRVDNMVTNLREEVANQPVKESIMSKILRFAHLKQ